MARVLLRLLRVHWLSPPACCLAFVLTQPSAGRPSNAVQAALSRCYQQSSNLKAPPAVAFLLERLAALEPSGPFFARFLVQVRMT